jgi:MOSC domain-containing protein YiiM
MSDRIEVISLHGGRIREYTDDQGQPWRSAIAKESLTGPIFLGRLGLADDQVGDPRHHGGPHQALLAYPVEHYAGWNEALGITAGPGGFGENLALEGLTEEEACLGDTFELGGALLQISQPRQPCHTLEKRWACPGLMEAILTSARGGWYLRVLEEGEIQAGQALVLVRRPNPGWTVARVFRAYLGKESEERRAAAALEQLTPKWQERLGASI